MDTHSTVFDASRAEDVTVFSLAIQDVISKHLETVSANIMYVIMHFHAQQMMNDIVTQSAERVAKREQEQQQS